MNRYAIPIVHLVHLPEPTVSIAEENTKNRRRTRVDNRKKRGGPTTE